MTLFASHRRQALRWRKRLLDLLEDAVLPERATALHIPRVFDCVVEEHGSTSCLLEKRDGAYRRIPLRDVREDARAFAAFLLQQGVGRGDRVAILAKNSPAWVIADLGSLMAGAVTVPLFTTSGPKDIRFILNHSEPSVLIVDTLDRVRELEDFPEAFPWIRLILLRQADGPLPAERFRSWSDALRSGRGALEALRPPLAEIRASTRLDDLASIVYTSGTTGEPKGVMLSHRNFLSDIRDIVSIMDVDHRDRALSLLPLSHVFERMAGYYYPLFVGCSIAYAEGIVGFDRNLLESAPTRLCTVPLFLERVHRRIHDSLAQAGAIQRALFAAALAVGERVMRHRESAWRRDPRYALPHHVPDGSERPRSLFWSAPHLCLARAAAELIVFRRIRKRFGGRLRCIVTGGAHLDVDVLRFLQNLGFDVYEGYGLTETSPVVSFNCRRSWRAGTAGKPLEHVALRFAEDGEIQVRGPNVTRGYYRDDEATAAAFDADGWFLTGDLGEFDEHHFLRITGRKKDLIVLCTGKKVAPLALESRLNRHPLVARSVVIGDGRDFVSALIFPNPAAMSDFAKANGLAEEDPMTVATRPESLREFSRIIKEVNASFSAYEQIRNFRVIPRDALQDRSLATPTLKIRRHAVEAAFASLIDEMYL